MRPAPAVAVVCTGGRWWQCALCGLPACATGALVMWALLHANGLTTATMAALALAGGGLAAALASRFLPSPVFLLWNGAQWLCQGHLVQVKVHLDLGPWMLLRLWGYPSGSAPRLLSGPFHLARRTAQARCPRWVAVSRHDAGPAMHAFRAAVYSRAPEATPSGSPPHLP